MDIVSLMHKSETNIVRIGQCFQSLEQREFNQPYSIFVQYQDQSFKILGAKNEPNSKIKSTVFPPPQAENVHIIRFCTLLKQLIVSTNCRSILFYRLDHITSIMTKDLKVDEIRDSENNKLIQRLSTFELGSIRPPNYDCQKYAQKICNKLKRQDTWY